LQARGEAESAGGAFEDVAEDIFDELGLKMEQQIGSGARAVVHRASSHGVNGLFPSGAEVAVKRLSGAAPSKKAYLEIINEAATWERLQHPNIVQLIYAKRKPEPVIVTEVCSAGRLFDYLHRHKAPLDVPSVALDLARGLEYMHAQGVAHRDVKSPNVLLVEDLEQGRLVAKLCDLGSCSSLEDSVPYRRPQTLLQKVGIQEQKFQPVGTLFWIAPEMLKPPTSDEPLPGAEGKCDVYSWALVVWELVARRVPWCDPKPADKETVTKNVTSGRRPPMPKYLTDEVKDLLEACWATTPSDRPTFEEVVRRLEEIDGVWGTDERFAEEADHARGSLDQWRDIGLSSPPPPTKKEKAKAKVSSSSSATSASASTSTNGEKPPSRLRDVFAAVLPNLYNTVSLTVLKIAISLGFRPFPPIQ